MQLTHIGLLTLLLAGIPDAGAASDKQALNLEDVIARVTETAGGATAIENVHAVRISIHIADPGKFEVDGVYHAARPGRMRIDITADGERVYTERFDGQKGWQWQKEKGEQEAGPTPTAALRHGVESPGKLFGLHEMRERGHRLDLRARETIDGTNYYVIHATFADGDETTLYVDPETWRITRRRDVRALHPDVDPAPVTIESRNSDWRQVDGVWFAFAGEDVDAKTGVVIETSKVKEIKVNPTLDPAIFENE
ncbi:MAG: hypothetical protein ABI540_06955 [Spartobacteria bacterium]